MRTTGLLVLLLGFYQANAVDLSGFNIPESQRAMLMRMSQRGISDERILKMAADFARNRNAPGGPPVPSTYVPPHTPAELDAVTRWAAGAAFSDYARRAGVNFNNAAFEADCPNLALYNFGVATNTAYLKSDVTIRQTNMSFQLNALLVKDPTRFRAEYLRLINDTAFARYVIDEPKPAPAIYPETNTRPAGTAE